MKESRDCTVEHLQGAERPALLLPTV